MKQLNTYISEALIKKHVDSIEYVDLGLKSGNLWAKYNYGAEDEFSAGDYFTGYEVNDIQFKGGELPDQDDCTELFNSCKITWDVNKAGYVVKGPNGNSIFFKSTGYIKTRQTEKTNKDTKVGCVLWANNASNGDRKYMGFIFRGKMFQCTCEYKLNIRLIIRTRG